MWRAAQGLSAPLMVAVQWMPMGAVYLRVRAISSVRTKFVLNRLSALKMSIASGIGFAKPMSALQPVFRANVAMARSVVLMGIAKSRAAQWPVYRPVRADWSAMMDSALSQVSVTLIPIV
jgi:hypothetical protein